MQPKFAGSGLYINASGLCFSLPDLYTYAVKSWPHGAHQEAESYTRFCRCLYTQATNHKLSAWGGAVNIAHNYGDIHHTIYCLSNSSIEE